MKNCNQPRAQHEDAEDLTGCSSGERQGIPGTRNEEQGRRKGAASCWVSPALNEAGALAKPRGLGQHHR